MKSLGAFLSKNIPGASPVESPKETESGMELILVPEDRAITLRESISHGELDQLIERHSQESGYELRTDRGASYLVARVYKDDEMIGHIHVTNGSFSKARQILVTVIVTGSLANFVRR